MVRVSQETILGPTQQFPLSLQALCSLGHSRVASLPEHRLDDTEISFRDALMSALAMFALKTPSLLACDKERAEGHVYTIDGMKHMRRCRTEVHATVQGRRKGGHTHYRYLTGQYLILMLRRV